MAASSRMLSKYLQPPSQSAGVHLESVSNCSAPEQWTNASSPETPPPILSSTCWMHCSWPPPLFWQIASMRIRFASGWWGVCLLHHPSPTNCHSHQLQHIRCTTSLAMGASMQSLRHMFSAVPLVAWICSSEGLQGVFQVRRRVVEVEKSSWKMLADWLDDFPAVPDALSVHWEITALVLRTAMGGTFETRHNHLSAGYILATVAHNLEFFCMRCW